jgi:hypothetical protein
MGSTGLKVVQAPAEEGDYAYGLVRGAAARERGGGGGAGPHLAARQPALVRVAALGVGRRGGAGAALSVARGDAAPPHAVVVPSCSGTSWCESKLWKPGYHIRAYRSGSSEGLQSGRRFQAIG